MKILMVTNLYPPFVIGGAEVFAHSLSFELAKNHEILVVTTCEPHKEKYRTETITKGLKVLRFFPKNLYWLYDRHPKPLWKKILWHAFDYFNLHTYFSLKKIIKEFNPDIIHTHNINGFSASVWSAAKNLRKPVIHTAHDGHFVCPQAGFFHQNQQIDCGRVACKIFRKMHRPSIKNVDLFITPSKFLLDAHIQLRCIPVKSKIIPNAIPTTNPKTFEPLLTHDTKTISVLYIGHLSQTKGSELLKACIHHFSDSSLKFHIAGKGPEEKALKELSTKYKNVFFHGFVQGEQKERLFTSSHILLFPSFSLENAPLTILEAMQYGLAILATDTGGVKEFVFEGKNGHLFLKNDEKRLISLLETLVRNPEHLKKLRTNSKECFQNFDMETCAKNYLSAYKEVLGDFLS